MAHSSARWDTGSQIIITRVLAAPNHHAVLGIRPNATAAEMRTARKKLIVSGMQYVFQKGDMANMPTGNGGLVWSPPFGKNAI